MIIDLDTLFPGRNRKTFTDIVSYCTDPFASVENKVLLLFLLMLSAAT